MGESHGRGTGPAGFGGAGCPAAAGEAGLVPAAAPGAFSVGGAPGVLAGGVPWAAVFAGGGSGAFEGLDVSDGGEGLLGVVLVSGCTDPGGEGFTPPGTAG
ncbi:MAG: hypothetical protein ACM3WP_21390 [Acidobacteriota bacterium]